MREQCDTHVESTVLEHLGEELGVLVHLVLDVDLLVGVTRERESEVRDDARLEVGLEFLASRGETRVSLSDSKHKGRRMETHP